MLESDIGPLIIGLLVVAPLLFWLVGWIYTLVRGRARIAPVRRGVPWRRRETGTRPSR